MFDSGIGFLQCLSLVCIWSAQENTPPYIRISSGLQTRRVQTALGRVQTGSALSKRKRTENK